MMAYTLVCNSFTAIASMYSSVAVVYKLVHKFLRDIVDMKLSVGIHFLEKIGSHGISLIVWSIKVLEYYTRG